MPTTHIHTHKHTYTHAHNPPHLRTHTHALNQQVDIAIQALNATGVSGKLNASTVATIFAPDDAAFISLASSLNFTSREQVFASPFATNVTLLHIIPGACAGARVVFVCACACRVCVRVLCLCN